MFPPVHLSTCCGVETYCGVETSTLFTNRTRSQTPRPHVFRAPCLLVAASSHKVGEGQIIFTLLDDPQRASPATRKLLSLYSPATQSMGFALRADSMVVRSSGPTVMGRATPLHLQLPQVPQGLAQGPAAPTST